LINATIFIVLQFKAFLALELLYVNYHMTTKTKWKRLLSIFGIYWYPFIVLY